MFRLRPNLLVCALLACALLCASSQYLAHFHVPQARAAAGDHAGDAAAHADSGDCSLCLQFDRLPAPPAALSVSPPYFFVIATLEAERLERIALHLPQLWPPARAPPVITC